MNKMLKDIFRQAKRIPLRRASMLKLAAPDSLHEQVSSIDFAVQNDAHPLPCSKGLLAEIAETFVPHQTMPEAIWPVLRLDEVYQRQISAHSAQQDYTCYTACSAPTLNNSLHEFGGLAVREADVERSAITDDFTTHRIRKELDPLELLKLDKYAKPWGNAFLDFIYDGMKDRERIAYSLMMRGVSSIRRSMNNIQQALAAFACTNYARGYAAAGSGTFS